MYRDIRAENILMTLSRPLAVVIEPQRDLAEVVRDALHQLGFEGVIAATHLGAAAAAEGRCPQLLIACVPAHADDAPGAYLHECRELLGVLPTVLMVSDVFSDVGNAPCAAVRLQKPFTRGELLLAVDQALAMGERTFAE